MIYTALLAWQNRAMHYTANSNQDNVLDSSIKFAIDLKAQFCLNFLLANKIEFIQSSWNVSTKYATIVFPLISATGTY